MVFEPQFSDDILPYIKTSMDSEDGKFVYTCIFSEECGKSFKKTAKIKEHVNGHLDLRPFVCPYENCDNAYKRKDHLNRHLISHQDNPKPFHCDQCEISFSSKSHLDRHKKRHAEDTKLIFQCSAPGCSERFAKKKQLKAHVELDHSAENEYVCPEQGCSKSFKTPSKLKYHMEAVHSNEPAMYVCGEVSCVDLPAFESKSLLMDHIKEHHKKEFKCKVEGCEKSYKSYSALREHFRVTHLWDEKKRESTFGCEVCGKVFANKSNLRTHVNNVHEKAYKHFCDLCTKPFATKASLLRHQKICGLPKPEKPVEKKKKKEIINIVAGTNTPLTSEDSLHRCPMFGCNCSFRNEYDLIRHIRSDRYHNAPTAVDEVK
ncbi:hypothetical protein MP638_004175 [Amoeboaphelidium occidentale]|nr:hypothetical protein MP638_004175 [Amoeboaphelidium occidentale]